MDNRTLDDLLFQIEELQDNILKLTDLTIVESDVLEKYKGLTIANWLETYLDIPTRGFDLNGWSNLVEEYNSPQDYAGPKTYMLSSEAGRMVDLVTEFYTKKINTLEGRYTKIYSLKKRLEG